MLLALDDVFTVLNLRFGWIWAGGPGWLWNNKEIAMRESGFSWFTDLRGCAHKIDWDPERPLTDLHARVRAAQELPKSTATTIWYFRGAAVDKRQADPGNVLINWWTEHIAAPTYERCCVILPCAHPTCGRTILLDYEDPLWGPKYPLKYGIAPSLEKWQRPAPVWLTPTPAWTCKDKLNKGDQFCTCERVNNPAVLALKAQGIELLHEWILPNSGNSFHTFEQDHERCKLYVFYNEHIRRYGYIAQGDQKFSVGVLGRAWQAQETVEFCVWPSSAEELKQAIFWTSVTHLAELANIDIRGLEPYLDDSSL